MPTKSLMQLPKTQSDEEFEKMCADVLTKKYQKEFYLYGRKGQEQNGIDLYCRISKDNIVVAQCKNYLKNSASVLKAQLSKDIKAANSLEFKFQKFIVMTSHDKDNGIQDYILSLNSGFEIEVFFWDDIQDLLCMHNDLLKKYYPDICLGEYMPAEDRNRIITATSCLKLFAKELNCGIEGYCPAVRYLDDINVYNKCVDMIYAISELVNLRYKWYIQLTQNSIGSTIDKLKSSMPEFYAEEPVGDGVNMIITITNYLNYFRDDMNTEKFVGECEKIIQMISKL